MSVLRTKTGERGRMIADDERRNVAANIRSAANRRKNDLQDDPDYSPFAALYAVFCGVRGWPHYEDLLHLADLIDRPTCLDLVEHNDRHDAQGLKRGVELIEHDVPFDVWRAWARDCQICWSGADFGLVIGGTAWGSSNSKTGCSTSHVGNARQNRNGTGGFARPEESGSGPQGYGIGKLRHAEWGTN